MGPMFSVISLEALQASHWHLNLAYFALGCTTTHWRTHGAKLWVKMGGWGQVGEMVREVEGHVYLKGVFFPDSCSDSSRY